MQGYLTKTVSSGDVHLAAIGQFYSNPKLDIPKDRDYRYMPNVISSAIADMPETEMISDMLNKRNRVHHMDTNTDEDMVPIFTHDVNNKPRNNKRLLPRRNWCSIREYKPGKLTHFYCCVFTSDGLELLCLTDGQVPRHPEHRPMPLLRKSPGPPSSRERCLSLAERNPPGQGSFDDSPSGARLLPRISTWERHRLRVG